MRMRRKRIDNQDLWLVAPALHFGGPIQQVRLVSTRRRVALNEIQNAEFLSVLHESPIRTIGSTRGRSCSARVIPPCETPQGSSQLLHIGIKMHRL